MIRSPAGFDGDVRIKRRLDYYQAGYGVMMLAASQAAPFTPAELFAAGEQGFWYDTSDLTTMFQDAAGTTPAALEQPVMLRLDKSGNGNDAVQTTSANAPVLSARYNQLIQTESFSNSAWTKTNVTPTQVSGEVWELDEGTATGNHLIYQIPFITIQGFSLAIDVKAGNASPWVRLTSRSNFVTNYLDFNLDTLDQVTNVGTVSAFSNPVFTVTPLADGWYRLEISCTSVLADAGGRPSALAILDASRNLSYTGTNRTILIRRPNVLLGQTDGAGLPNYQRVTTATDYDTTDFPYYLRYNGTNQWMQTSAIDFSGTDAVSVFAGVRKLSDAARGNILELTASADANNGAFHLTGPNAASATYAFESKGTALTDAVSGASFVAPITNLLTGLADISTPSNILRVNGVQVDSDANSQGSGSYANAAVYLGSRGGTTLWFNGRDYGLICVGRAVTAAELANTESWLAGKTGVTL